MKYGANAIPPAPACVWSGDPAELDDLITSMLEIHDTIVVTVKCKGRSFRLDAGNLAQLQYFERFVFPAISPCPQVLVCPKTA